MGTQYKTNNLISVEGQKGASSNLVIGFFEFP